MNLGTFVAFQHSYVPMVFFYIIYKQPTRGLEGGSGVKGLAVQAEGLASGSLESHHVGWVWQPASNPSLRRQRYEEVLGTS